MHDEFIKTVGGEGDTNGNGEPPQPPGQCAPQPRYRHPARRRPQPHACTCDAHRRSRARAGRRHPTAMGPRPTAASLRTLPAGRRIAIPARRASASHGHGNPAPARHERDRRRGRVRGLAGGQSQEGPARPLRRGHPGPGVAGRPALAPPVPAAAGAFALGARGRRGACLRRLHRAAAGNPAHLPRRPGRHGGAALGHHAPRPARAAGGGLETGARTGGRGSATPAPPASRPPSRPFHGPPQYRWTTRGRRTPRHWT